MTTDTGYEAREAERSVLQLVMVHEKCAGLVNRLEESDFVDAGHRRLFGAMRKRVAEKKPVDLVAMCDVFPDKTAWLAGEVGRGFALPTSADAYVDMLHTASRRRNLYMTGKRLMSESANADISELIDKTRIRLKELSFAQEDEESISDVIFRVHEGYYSDRRDKMLRLKIGALDGVLVGLEPGALYVVGARPSVGKSVFGMLATLSAGEQGKKALVINREMKKENVLVRMIANRATLDIGKIRKGLLSENEQAQMISAYTELEGYGFDILNRPRTPAQIREAALRMKEDVGLDLLVVDYLQRLGSGRKTNSRVEEVGAISMGLKDIAMELDVPVLLLSQLNRSASNQRPTMAQLRESGDIEQDADAVILLHLPDESEVPGNRLDQYRLCEQRGGRYLEMIVDKNREGERAIMPVMFEGRYMRYTPL